MARIGITGSSGFVGRALAARLRTDGREPVALPRAPSPKDLDGLSAVVHLAGEPVAQRWTKAARARIRGSRVDGTRALVAALGKLDGARRPRVLVSASAIGFYGDRGDEQLTEISPRGTGFLSDVVVDWELEALTARAHSVRVSCLRFGVVLGKGGGALTKMPPVAVGNGRQWMSWVHLADLVAMIEAVLDQEDLSGVFNAVSPSPVRNSDFVRELARAKGWPVTLPFGVPQAFLKAGLGEMATMLLESERVLPGRFASVGFKFRYTELGAALREVFR